MKKNWPSKSLLFSYCKANGKLNFYNSLLRCDNVARKRSRSSPIQSQIRFLIFVGGGGVPFHPLTKHNTWVASTRRRRRGFHVVDILSASSPSQHRRRRTTTKAQPSVAHFPWADPVAHRKPSVSAEGDFNVKGCSTRSCVTCNNNNNRSIGKNIKDTQW